MGDRWHPQIGDPSAIGWITVAAYLLATGLCLAAQRQDAAAAPKHFWTALAVVLLLLGINKQLDLQSLLTQVVRDWTKTHGVYEQRRALQAAFIFAIAAIGTIMLVVTSYIMRRQAAPRKIALAGMIFLYSFILIRASSFHHVDWALGRSIFSVRLNVVLEIGGISIVASASALVLRLRADAD